MVHITALGAWCFSPRVPLAAPKIENAHELTTPWEKITLLDWGSRAREGGGCALSLIFESWPGDCDAALDPARGSDPRCSGRD